MANDLKFEDKQLPLFELLKENKLPIVVRVCEEANADDKYDYYHERISGKTEVFLQKALKIKFALVKVLRYYDKAVKEKEHGPEYVLEHDTYIGKDFYIPVKYNGSFKFSHWPGSRRRYATISQVLDELPRYITLNEFTEATNGSGQKVTIPARTKLELKQKFKDPQDGSVRLGCSDGKGSFSFSTKDRINCSEVDDPKTYHMFELVRNKMLPKVIIFQNVALDDGILMDNELNSALLTSVEGPIQLIRFEDIEVAVGWVRDKEARTYKTVLIPSGMWNGMLVQEKSLHSEEDKRNYIKDRYKHCENTLFLETFLYWIIPEKDRVSWLVSPDFYTRNVTGKHMFEPIHIDDFQDSTDDEVFTDYEEIFETPPPLPERKATLSDSQEHHKQTKEKQSLFRKVHKELLGMFKHVHAKDHKTDGQPPKVPKRRHTYLSKGDNSDAGDSSHDGFTSSTSTTDTSVVNISHKISTPESSRTSSDSSDSDIYQEGPLSESESSYDYDYPYMENFTGPSKGAAARQRPLPQPPETRDSVSSTTTDLSRREKPTVATGIEKKQQFEKKVPKYVSVVMNESNHLFLDNLTANDFYQYTVMEAAQCFDNCGLSDFANECFKNKIDGSFFENIDFEELKKEPFRLSSFHILKIKKMIFDGWRPKNL